jgi:hypothetical protein
MSVADDRNKFLSSLRVLIRLSLFENDVRGSVRRVLRSVKAIMDAARATRDVARSTLDATRLIRDAARATVVAAWVTTGAVGVTQDASLDGIAHTGHVERFLAVKLGLTLDDVATPDA